MSLMDQVGSARRKLLNRIQADDNLLQFSTKMPQVDMTKLRAKIEKSNQELAELDGLATTCGRTFGSSPTERGNLAKLEKIVRDLDKQT